MSTKSKYPITRRDFLKLGAFFPFSFLLGRLFSFLKGPEPPLVTEAWDPWKEILPLVVRRKEVTGEKALLHLSETQKIVASLKGQFPLEGPFERKTTQVLLKNRQTFWQESIWYPGSSLLLLRSEFETPFRSKVRRCGLKSEVRLHWLDKETRKVYTPFVASNGEVLYQQSELSPIVLSSDCPGNLCSGYCDYTCNYPLPPQGDRFCRSLPCVADWWCLIRCGAGCATCAPLCLDQQWWWCIACVIANCACGHCYSRRWTCDVCP